MSLTVRQVQQYSAVFKQQLDQFNIEVDSNEKTADRIENIFRQMQPQLNAVSKSLDSRSADLDLVQRKLLAAQQTVDVLIRETHDLDIQTSQAVRVSEALSHPQGARVFAVPSTLTENFVATLERNLNALSS